MAGEVTDVLAIASAVDGPLLLVETAKALEPLDVLLARATYLDAWMASLVAGPHARPGSLLPEVSRAAREAPPAPHGAPATAGVA